MKGTLSSGVGGTLQSLCHRDGETAGFPIQFSQIWQIAGCDLDY